MARAAGWVGDGGPRLLLSEKEREGGCRRVRGGEKEDRLKVETGGAPCSLEDAALTRGSAAALSDPSASSPTDRNIQRHFPPPTPDALLRTGSVRHAAGRPLGRVSAPRHLPGGAVDRAAVEHRLSGR